MIDPRPYIGVGAILVRKQPNDDAWDKLRVEGFAEYDGGVIEVVVRPVEFGEALSVDAEALDTAYYLESDGEPLRARWEDDAESAVLRRDLQEIEAAREVIRISAEPDPESADEPSPRLAAWRRTHNPKEHING